jgi:serine/threonine-protein kinase RsbW
MKPHAQAPSRVLHCVIPSSLGEVDAVCQELRAFLQASGRAADFFAVELLAREALNNAILHGNRSQARKTTCLTLRLGRRWLRLQIADEGPGFDWRSARRSVTDTSATHGRGLAIGALYADRVGYNQRGNQITLWLDNRNSAKRHQHGNLHD